MNWRPFVWTLSYFLLKSKQKKAEKLCVDPYKTQVKFYWLWINLFFFIFFCKSRLSIYMKLNYIQNNGNPELKLKLCPKSCLVLQVPVVFLLRNADILNREEWLEGQPLITGTWLITSSCQRKWITSALRYIRKTTQVSKLSCKMQQLSCSSWDLFQVYDESKQKSKFTLHSIIYFNNTLKEPYSISEWFIAIYSTQDCSSVKWPDVEMKTKLLCLCMNAINLGHVEMSSLQTGFSFFIHLSNNKTRGA